MSLSDDFVDQIPDTDPEEISKYVAEQIRRFEAGGKLENVVDRGRGY